MLSQGERGGGQKLPILLSKKTTKRGGGGQKSQILRRHRLWTALSERHGNGPKHNLSECMWRSDVADFYPHFFYFRSILIHMSYAGGMGRYGMINDAI